MVGNLRHHYRSLWGWGITNDAHYGSLARDWIGDFIWCNPPYSLRSWATFLEKADHEVDVGHAGIVVALVPRDDADEHAKYLFGKHAYRIEITRNIPFFKRQKKTVKKGGIVRTFHDIIDIIRGNQFVVFGKGSKTKVFLNRFVDELFSMGYITENHHRHYTEVFNSSPRLAA